MSLNTSLWRSVWTDHTHRAKSKEQVELAMDDLRAIETFLNAVEHYSADSQKGSDVHQVTPQALVLLHYAQERTRRARKRLDLLS